MNCRPSFELTKCGAVVVLVQSHPAEVVIWCNLGGSGVIGPEPAQGE